MNITVPIEDVVETEKFLDLLDDAQYQMLYANDNSFYAFASLPEATSSIAFGMATLSDYENAMIKFENAKDIAPTEDYEEICGIYVKLAEKRISCQKHIIAIAINTFDYEQYENSHSKRDVAMANIIWHTIENTREELGYIEFCGDLFRLVEKL